MHSSIPLRETPSPACGPAVHCCIRASCGAGTWQLHELRRVDELSRSLPDQEPGQARVPARKRPCAVSPRRNVAGPPDRTDASGLPFSAFLAIPHVPVLVEVASLERTFLESVEWSECHQAQPPVWTGRRAVAEAQAAAGDALLLNFSETELWPRRFVFPTSGNATVATEYVTRYMVDSLQNTASSRSDGNCVEVSRGEWSGPESSFEMEWVQQRSVAHGSMIAHWETHVQQRFAIRRLQAHLATAQSRRGALLPRASCGLLRCTHTGAWRHCGRGDLSHHIQR